MSQEGWSQTCTAGGALDESGDITEYQSRAFFSYVANSQIGNDRGKRIVGNLGTRSRCRGQQGRFSGVGHSQKADVGDQPELHRQPPLHTRLAMLQDLRSGSCARFEGCIAATAPPALGYNQAFTVVAQFPGDLLRFEVPNDRSRWYFHENRFSLLSGLRLSEPVSSLHCSHVHPVTERRQSIQTLVAFQIDRSAPSATATARTTEGFSFFSTKRHASVAAIATTDMQTCSIKKLPFRIISFRSAV
mmetsp:Transcript_20386/g.23261  ORF Transcript_20386/g.23261 Transcript_20386/m.23261 type:complete len:246 (+) Transcript_20386:122-859(+)